jgi:hypothetical protein
MLYFYPIANWLIEDVFHKFYPARPLLRVAPGGFLSLRLRNDMGWVVTWELP